MNNGNGKAGETRSILRREYLLHTPDAFVRTPMQGLTNGLAIVHASPQLGADFLQYTVELGAGGSLAPVAAQRFVWVLEGEILIEPGSALQAREYAYMPEGFTGSIHTRTASRLVVIEKKYEALAGAGMPRPFVASEAMITAIPLEGDPDLLVKSLLPADVSFDFAVNTMTYAPGSALAQVEVHVMEHGLVMLEGAGTYRLGDDRYAVEAGDFIWMAPYCPQWFIATGDVPAKYLIYKNWNRRPRL